MKKNTGINGFGRVGLHLLKYWLDRNNDTNFDINSQSNDFYLAPGWLDWTHWSTSYCIKEKVHRKYQNSK